MQIIKPATVMLITILISLVQSPVFAGCGVTIKANYKTPVTNNSNEPSRLKVYLYLISDAGRKSQVRTKLGTWAGLDKCDWSARTYEVGDAFTVACKLHLSCNKKRRYRLYVRAEDSMGISTGTAYIYYPSPSGWAEKGETTINFGDMGKIFN